MPEDRGGWRRHAVLVAAGIAVLALGGLLLVAAAALAGSDVAVRTMPVLAFVVPATVALALLAVAIGTEWRSFRTKPRAERRATVENLLLVGSILFGGEALRDRWPLLPSPVSIAIAIVMVLLVLFVIGRVAKRFGRASAGGPRPGA